ncbi:Potassium uptake protein TrkH [invertebrate metagenome]|uniref:Potassium uptake protein TrkH n=1 Tax=invertebrate metagenome TaxID=1711999 RepID=A0A484H5T4_9ZZZZ
MSNKAHHSCCPGNPPSETHSTLCSSCRLSSGTASHGGALLRDMIKRVMVEAVAVLYFIGVLLLVLSGTMILPILADLYTGTPDWHVFLVSAIVTCSVGATTTIAYRPLRSIIILSTRQAFLLTTGAWLVVCSFGSLPFLFSSLNMSPTDAFFEAMSGLTTTGSTVMTGLDTAPRGILLWRSLLQWLGGIGIIVMAVAVFPDLRIGGMQLFRMESSDKTDKAMPRVSQIAGTITVLYGLFSVVCALILWVAGMDGFDAINHAMTTLATGGYSTFDQSVGHFQSPLIEWILIIFMMIGATPFVLFIMLWQHKEWRLLGDSQVRWFYGGTAVSVLVLATWLWTARDISYNNALRSAAFNVVSVITTCGYVSTDYATWGGFAQTIFFWLTFVGGCTGSTSGAIKVFRFQVLFSLIAVQFKRLLHQTGVFLVHFDKEQISDDVVRSVQGFVVLYTVCFTVIASALMVTGLNLVTALSGSATALGNVGPGLGPTIGPAGNFSSLSDTAKWILACTMLLGRLELLTVLVLLRRSFWQDHRVS